MLETRIICSGPGECGSTQLSFLYVPAALGRRRNASGVRNPFPAPGQAEEVVVVAAAVAVAVAAPDKLRLPPLLIHPGRSE